LKIAIIVPDDFSIVCFCEILVRKLLLNNEVTIISDIHNGFKPGHYLNIMKLWGVQHRHVSFYRFINPLKDIKYIMSLHNILKVGRFDIVLNIATKPNLYGSIAAKLAKVDKIICSVWGLGLAFSEKKSLKNTFLKYVVKIFYSFAFKVSDKIWFTNKNDSDYFISRGIVDKNKTILTKFYVNTDLYSPSAVSENTSIKLKSNLGYKSSDKIVIMLARLSWAKGVKQFCEASDLLRKDYPSVKFLLVGPEDTGSIDCVPASYIKNYQKHVNFNWIGFRSDVKELFSICDIATYPSYYREGGYPKGLTEPMSMGKPVITTDSEHCSAAVEDGISGIIFPVKDSIAFAEAIKKIINNEELASTLGKKARERVLSELDEEKIISKLILDLI